MSDLEGSVRGIYSHGVEILYFMRGAYDRDDMFDMTPIEKEIISEFLEKRINSELEKETNHVY